MDYISPPLFRYFHSVSPRTRGLLYLLIITSVSSFLFEDASNSNSFLADVNNPINQYFVKWAWAWTFYPLCILFTINSITYKVANIIVILFSLKSFLRRVALMHSISGLSC